MARENGAVLFDGDGAWDPDEECRACGYAIGQHATATQPRRPFDEGGCPTEFGLLMLWGLL